MRRRDVCRSTIALAGAFALGSGAAHAQAYPSQRITVVVAFAPGGSVDATGRIIAEKLSERWGQPVVVENRLGAAGNIAASAIARAAPDGYTLLVTASGIAINQTLYEKPGYSIKDLRPIAFPAVNSCYWRCTPTIPHARSRRFSDAHRSKSFTFGTAGVGSGAHITAAYLFKELAKVEAILTPFQGGAPAGTALLGKHIDLISVAVPDVAALVQAGQLRALGVSGAERLEALPDVPTYSEAGFPGFVVYGWTGIFVPARTDDRIAEALNVAVNEILAMPDVQRKLAAVGFSPNRQSLADTTTRLGVDLGKWREMVEALGLKIK